MKIRTLLIPTIGLLALTACGNPEPIIEYDVAYAGKYAPATSPRPNGRTAPAGTDLTIPFVECRDAYGNTLQHRECNDRTADIRGGGRGFDPRVVVDIVDDVVDIIDRDRPDPGDTPDDPVVDVDDPEPRPEPPVTPPGNEEPKGGPQGNNGHGNGDQDAPGNSGPNNNAENSEHSGQGNSGNGKGGKK